MMRAEAPVLRRGLLALLLLEILCFGPHLFRTGFYLDDWVFLERTLPLGRALTTSGGGTSSLNGSVGRGGLFAAMRAFASAGFWTRPLEILHFPVLIRAVGLKPWRYRLINLGMEMLLGATLMWTLRLLTGNADLALLAALLATAFPNHDATNIWMSQAPQVAAMTLCFTSLALRLEGLKAPTGGGYLCAAQTCYILGILEYESIVFMPALLVGALFARSMRSGAGARRAAREAVWSGLPYLFSAAIVTLYQRMWVPRFVEASPKKVVFSLGHASQVYAAALRCCTSGILRILGHWRPGMAAGYAWCVLPVAAYALSRMFRYSSRKKTERRNEAAVCLAAGACAFTAGYLPYALTGAYTPRMYGVMNRVNMGGGIASGIMLAGILWLVPESSWRLRRRAFAAVLAVCATCHWITGSQWVAAWGAQQSILSSIQAQLPAGPITVILDHTRPLMGGVPVFLSYDIPRALRLTTGRADIDANWALRAYPKKDALEVINGDEAFSRYPYKNLYLYEGISGRLVPLSGVTSSGRPVQRWPVMPLNGG